MLFAETDRLTLRALEEHELPRLAELLDEWDVARWMAVLPFPYRLRDAEEFYADIRQRYDSGEPQFYAMALKSDNLLIGGVGLHPPRGDSHDDGEIEMGYWLAKPFWNRGLMSEAVRAVISIGFDRPTTAAICATTAPHNKASQNVLAKLGLRNLGLFPRGYAALRGTDEILRWRLTRAEWLAAQNVKQSA